MCLRSHAESQLFRSPASVDKSYVFRQPKSEYSVLPRTGDTDNGSSVVSEQPRLHFDKVSSPETGTCIHVRIILLTPASTVYSVCSCNCASCCCIWSFFIL